MPLKGEYKNICHVMLEAIIVVYSKLFIYNVVVELILGF